MRYFERLMLAFTGAKTSNGVELISFDETPKRTRSDVRHGGCIRRVRPQILVTLDGHSQCFVKRHSSMVLPLLSMTWIRQLEIALTLIHHVFLNAYCLLTDRSHDIIGLGVIL